ncbi:hypothetical protein HAX54_032865 [Datura stramonium]|uniref:Uncharacterized protein n=1 Tax=Datura stramonium TaxID=4076 RepID=A0ABS8RLL2_DATST|nr:hypothetical protein [Datura stramonium]
MFHPPYGAPPLRASLPHWDTHRLCPASGSSENGSSSTSLGRDGQLSSETIASPLHPPQLSAIIYPQNCGCNKLPHLTWCTSSTWLLGPLPDSRPLAARCFSSCAGCLQYHSEAAGKVSCDRPTMLTLLHNSTLRGCEALQLNTTFLHGRTPACSTLYGAPLLSRQPSSLTPIKVSPAGLIRRTAPVPDQFGCRDGQLPSSETISPPASIRQQLSAITYPKTRGVIKPPQESELLTHVKDEFWLIPY